MIDKKSQNEEYYERIMNLLLEVFQENEDYYKSFMNPGIIVKKSKSQFDLLKISTEFEDRLILKTGIDDIIKTSFQHLDISNTKSIKISDTYIYESQRLIENILYEIERDIYQNKYEYQINKPRIIYYGYKQYNCVNFRTNLDKVFVPNLEDIYISSGPIIDLNGISVAVSTEILNPYDNTFNIIQITTPIAKQHIIRIKTTEDDNHFLRIKKIQQLK